LQKLISSKPVGFDYCKRQRELLYLLEEDELIERLIGLLPTDSYPSGLLSPPMKFESPLNQESKGSCQTLSSSTEEPDDEDQHGTNVSVLAHETVTIFYLLINKLRSKNDSKSGKRSVAMVSNSFMMTDLSIQTHWLIKQLLDNRMALIEVASSSQCRIAAKPVISLFQFLLHHVRMHIDDFIEESHEDFTQRLESLPSLSSPFSSLPLTQELTPKELLGQKLEDIEDFLTDYFEQYRTIVQDHCTSKSNSLEWYDDMSKYQSSHPQTLDQTIDFSKRIPVKVEYADICDACMECNDMCGHPDCFLCTQKEYHVQNSILPTSRTENNSRDQGVTTVSSRHCFSASALESVTGARTQRIPHNQSDERRNFKDYSSCEVERMQRNGSKILIVDSAVYDVTLLFEFYPHPVKSLQRLRSDDKRHFLGDYLIGNYYACETPITLKQW
jgi:hypothetical protein